MWTLILNFKWPISLLFLPVASFLMPLAVFLLLLPLSLLTNAEEKVFLVETKEPAGDTNGVDYASSHIGESYFGMANCRHFCKTGICVKMENVKQTAWTKSIECQRKPTPPTTVTQPPPPAIAAATMPIASCLKTPREVKGHENRLGFRVLKMRGTANFCCNRGRKKGKFVRTPRCCMAKGNPVKCL